MADEATIDYYDHNAGSFAKRTLHASMDECLDRFCEQVKAGGLILDWGCGAGRDAHALQKRGFEVVATDASREMCRVAESVLGGPVRHEEFLELPERDCFEGIWACASLLHLPRPELRRAFAVARCALAKGGAMYASFKWGYFEGIRNGRWFTDLQEVDLPSVVGDGWKTVDVWRSMDVREGRGDETWLNVLVSKVC